MKYNQECDLWSCGIILYVFLFGVPPFNGRSQKEIFYKIKEKMVSFPNTDISSQAKDLVQKLLEKDFTKRIDAQQALAHSWIQENNEQQQINTKMIENLQKFQSQTKLTTALMTFIVTQILESTELQDIRKTFKALDTDGNGRLSRQELTICFNKLGFPKDQIENYIDKIMNEFFFTQDDKDKGLDYTC